MSNVESSNLSDTTIEPGCRRLVRLAAKSFIILEGRDDARLVVGSGLEYQVQVPKGSNCDSLSDADKTKIPEFESIED